MRLACCARTRDQIGSTHVQQHAHVHVTCTCRCQQSGPSPLCSDCPRQESCATGGTPDTKVRGLGAERGTVSRAEVLLSGDRGTGMNRYRGKIEDIVLDECGNARRIISINRNREVAGRWSGRGPAHDQSKTPGMFHTHARSRRGRGRGVGGSGDGTPCRFASYPTHGRSHRAARVP